MEKFMRTLKTEELAMVAGGDPGGVPPSTKRADNGWGNGPDSTNSGSFSGGTVSSKEDNTDPGGPGPEKFTTR
jgi:hypothetical protein